MEAKSKNEKQTLLERNLEIFLMYTESGMKISEIAKAKNLSYSVVWHVIDYLKKVQTSGKSAIQNFFDMGFEIYDILESLGEESDVTVMRVMKALWLHEYANRAKFRKLTNEQFEEFLTCKQMFCAGEIVHEALRIYRKKLRKTV